jgi:hypothetical protein
VAGELLLVERFVQVLVLLVLVRRLFRELAPLTKVVHPCGNAAAASAERSALANSPATKHNN